MIKDGRPVDFGSFLIPRSEYDIEDVWHVVGLRGTGSNTLHVKNVFVPRHRFLSYKAMNDHTAPGLQTNTAPVYKMPWAQCIPPQSPRRSWAWPTVPTRRTWSIRASGCARRSPVRRPRTTRSPRCASPRRPATSTPRGVS
ncbi:flavin-dependent monooxygenase, oxygenase subunit [Mycobacterium xenopi 4042]|uniref:Flavin-dependent monooxygenase, oxygenase subunit n=1 Tax=Mycobacterium xenopi 4042 TaxID=1299334 RepID=X7ZWK3_MYCXE|nr:flavin-dependent monooxygenase, oxygenase subunit [Mycobacterium xenopi 4042]